MAGDRAPGEALESLRTQLDDLAALYDDTLIRLPTGSALAITADHEPVAVTGSVEVGTCVLFDDATVACGSESIAHTDGPPNTIAIGAELDGGGLCSVLADGSIRCDQESCAPPTYYRCTSDGAIDLGAPAVAVTSGGDDFACALLRDGNIKCWTYLGQVPSAPGPWLGAALDFTWTSDGGADAGIAYGAWHTIDLGTRP